MPELLLYNSIRTDQVPAADRLDFVREITATTWVPMECHSEHGDYRGEFRASGLGAMQVVVMDVMPITVRRTPRLISQAAPDMLRMVLVCGGNSCVVGQDGRQARLSAAEFAIYDTRRPYEVTCGAGADRPTQMMTFMFPPSLLPLSRSRLGRLAAVRFPASAGLGDVTSQFLLQLARNVDHYSPAEAARLSTAALVAGWIRRRRLECCRHELSDPALASRPVAAIAARWGLSSAGDFSRAFRAVHGLPPAEYRMSARIVKGSAR